MRTEIYSLALTLVFVGLHFWLPDLVQDLSPWFLAVGLIFPGIPHGAVDHWVRLKNVQWFSKAMALFFAQYILVMLLVAGLWWLSPALGLLSFIGYSAWHFGETDLRDWQQYSPRLSWFWGSGVLLTLLFSHPAEFAYYLKIYGLNPMGYWWQPGLASGLIALALALFMSRDTSFRPMALTALVVALGSFLPLLLAFALYFIVGHSFRGWRHLQAQTPGGFSALLKMALPFSLLAFVFLGVAIGLGAWFSADGLEFWPWLFVFVAALSAPHVWVMHGFYQKGQQVTETV